MQKYKRKTGVLTHFASDKRSAMFLSLDSTELEREVDNFPHFIGTRVTKLYFNEITSILSFSLITFACKMYTFRQKVR